MNLFKLTCSATLIAFLSGCFSSGHPEQITSVGQTEDKTTNPLSIPDNSYAILATSMQSDLDAEISKLSREDNSVKIHVKFMAGGSDGTPLKTENTQTFDIQHSNRGYQHLLKSSFAAYHEKNPNSAFDEQCFIKSQRFCDAQFSFSIDVLEKDSDKRALKISMKQLKLAGESTFLKKIELSKFENSVLNGDFTLYPENDFFVVREYKKLMKNQERLDEMDDTLNEALRSETWQDEQSMKGYVKLSYTIKSKESDPATTNAQQPNAAPVSINKQTSFSMKDEGYSKTLNTLFDVIKKDNETPKGFYERCLKKLTNKCPLDFEINFTTISDFDDDQVSFRIHKFGNSNRIIEFYSTASKVNGTYELEPKTDW